MLQVKMNPAEFSGTYKEVNKNIYFILETLELKNYVSTENKYKPQKDN